MVSLSKQLSQFSHAGENPYFFIASLLGKRKEFLFHTQQYLTTEQDSSSYRSLIEWEVKSFNYAYLKKYGKLPKAGDIESLLPQSQISADNYSALSILQTFGIQLGIVSSGFSALVNPLANRLGLSSKFVLANDLVYDKQYPGLKTIRVRVFGNKQRALRKMRTAFAAHANLEPHQIAYVDDNLWGKPGMVDHLKTGGYVFYLGDDAKKQYPLPAHDSLRRRAHFYAIPTLAQLVNHPLITSGKIKGIMFDADGTLLSTPLVASLRSFVKAQLQAFSFKPLGIFYRGLR